MTGKLAWTLASRQDSNTFWPPAFTRVLLTDAPRTKARSSLDQSSPLSVKVGLQSQPVPSQHKQQPLADIQLRRGAGHKAFLP